jgi:hypothetical protein
MAAAATRSSPMGSSSQAPRILPGTLALRAGPQIAASVRTVAYASPEAALTTEEFRKLSALAALLIPHDGAGLTIRSRDQLDVRLFLNVDDADPNAAEDFSAPVDGDVARLMTDEEARARGFGAGVRVPIRVTNETGGFLTLFARQPQTYGDDTLRKAQTLADYICAVLPRSAPAGVPVARLAEFPKRHVCPGAAC